MADNSKIDTQGMSGEVVKGCTDNVYPRDTNGNIIYPPAKFKKLTIITSEVKKELKDLINEVLDEREHQKKLNGPYDVYRLDELQE